MIEIGSQIYASGSRTLPVTVGARLVFGVSADGLVGVVVPGLEPPPPLPEPELPLPPVPLVAVPPLPLEPEPR